MFRNFRFKEKRKFKFSNFLDTSFRIDRRIEGGERERESRSKSRSQNAEIAKDSRGGRGGWTVRFLLVRLRLCRRTKLCGQWRNAAEPLLETRYMHGAPRRYKGAPTPANPPSILSIAVPVASVTQLPDGSNYVVAVRSHPPPPPPHLSLSSSLQLCLIRFCPLTVGISYPTIYSSSFYICPFVFPFPRPIVNRSLPRDTWTPVSYISLFLAGRHVNPVR